MNKDIFESINRKLTPDSNVLDELYKKADTLTPGEKYIGDPEKIFLSKGIIPETGGKDKELPAARVKDNRLVIAAAAAVIALTVGAVAILGAVSQGKLETTQKNEESKTTTTHPQGQIKNTETDSPYPWIELRKLINEAHAEYRNVGYDSDKLLETDSFVKLVSFSGRLDIYIADMVQNGELEGELLSVVRYADEVRKNNDFNSYPLSAESGLDYIFYYSSKQGINDLNIEDYIGTDNYSEDYKDFIEPFIAIKDYDDYKGTEEYAQIKKLTENDKYGFWDTLTQIYYLGGVDEACLDIALEAYKDAVRSGDVYTGGFPEFHAVSNDRYDDYYSELASDPKAYFTTDEEVDLWVRLKLARVDYNSKYGSLLDIHEDKNFMSLQGLGYCTAARAILHLCENGEIEYLEMESTIDELLGLSATAQGTGAERSSSLDQAIKSLCINADFVSGMCDGNYRESGSFLNNRNGLDRLDKALLTFIDTLPQTPDDSADTADARENAYAYLDVYDCTPHTQAAYNAYEIFESSLHVIVPDKDGDTVIVNGIEYTGLDESTMGEIAGAIQDIIPPYGKKAEAPEYLSATITSPDGELDVEQKGGSILAAYAGHIRDNSLSTLKEPDSFEMQSGIAISFDSANEESEYAIHYIYIPELSGDYVIINVRLYRPGQRVISELIDFLGSTGALDEPTEHIKDYSSGELYNAQTILTQNSQELHLIEASVSESKGKVIVKIEDGFKDEFYSSIEELGISYDMLEVSEGDGDEPTEEDGLSEQVIGDKEGEDE